MNYKPSSRSRDDDGGLDRRKSAEVIDALRAALRRRAGALTEAYAGAQKKVIAGAKYTDETIRANPYQSLASQPASVLLVGYSLAAAASSRSAMETTTPVKPVSLVCSGCSATACSQCAGPHRAYFD